MNFDYSCNKFENILAKEEAGKISSGLRGGEIAAIGK